MAHAVAGTEGGAVFDQVADDGDAGAAVGAGAGHPGDAVEGADTVHDEAPDLGARDRVAVADQHQPAPRPPSTSRTLTIGVKIT